jgi:hypothetical protein
MLLWKVVSLLLSGFLRSTVYASDVCKEVRLLLTAFITSRTYIVFAVDQIC